MLTAIEYLTKIGWKISSDPRKYDNYPKNYGYRNYQENGVNYDSFCKGYHRAFDLYSNATNDVPAVTSGTVVTSETHGNFGGTVEIRDANGNDWIYGHLQRNSLRFSKGDKVNQGDVVGLQGSSNYYDNPMNAHLHLQLRPKGTNLNDEVAEVCSGMPIEKYDISKLNAKQDKSKNKGVKKMGKKILLTAGHGQGDPGATGYGTNERDFIRKHIVDRIAKYLTDAGNKVEVFDKAYDMLQVTFDGTGKHGLYWAKNQKFDEVVEFHLDAASPSASGGHVIVWHEFKADAVDNGLQKALSNTVGVLHGISYRDNLGNARIAAQLGVSYRLVELGFITSKKDMDYITKNIASFTKALAAGIDSSVNGVSTHKVDKEAPKLIEVAKKKKAAIKKTEWEQNQYDTWYKPEKATFVNGNEKIQVRSVGPFLLSDNKEGMLPPFEPIEYDEVMLQNGYVWVGYDGFKGERLFLPVRKWDGTPPPNLNGHLGPLWGTIK